jgi:hypothetical protein
MLNSPILLFIFYILRLYQLEAKVDEQSRVIAKYLAYILSSAYLTTTFQPSFAKKAL